MIQSSQRFLSSESRKTDDACLICSGAVRPKEKQQKLGENGWLRFKGVLKHGQTLIFQGMSQNIILQKSMNELKMWKRHLEMFTKHVGLSLQVIVVATSKAMALLISAHKKFPLVPKPRVKLLLLQKHFKHIQQGAIHSANLFFFDSKSKMTSKEGSLGDVVLKALVNILWKRKGFT